MLAVNDVVLPVCGTTVPKVGGFTDQVGATGTPFPYASVPVAVNTCGCGALTSTDKGLTLSAATAPGVIVTVCVTLVAPGADAVSTGLPARVSC